MDGISYKKTKLYICIIAAISIFLSWILIAPFHSYAAESSTAAAEKTSTSASHKLVKTDTAWLRAKIDYTYDDNITEVNDEALHFVEPEKWTKRGDWYYYSDQVKNGDKIRFFDSLQLPTSWKNNTADEKFDITVTVQAAEVLPGQTGWDSNQDASYSQTFSVWKNGYTAPKGYDIQEGKLSVALTEYQLDKNGKEVAYQNDKLVVPGQKVSKIVEFDIEGQKGGLFKLPVKLFDRQTGDMFGWYVLAMIGGIAALTAGIIVTERKKKQN